MIGYNTMIPCGPACEEYDTAMTRLPRAFDIFPMYQPAIAGRVAYAIWHDFDLLISGALPSEL